MAKVTRGFFGRRRSAAEERLPPGQYDVPAERRLDPRRREASLFGDAA
jgi:hypothetical protein